VAALALRERLVAELDALLVLPPEELLARRYEKYRHLGPFTVASSP
jgi:acetyl-CoA carboxylase alpha subunit